MSCFIGFSCLVGQEIFPMEVQSETVAMGVTEEEYCDHGMEAFHRRATEIAALDEVLIPRPAIDRATSG